MQYCDSTCFWCAKRFFTWWKERTINESRVKPGETTSWTQAAVTSVKPEDDQATESP